MAGKDARKPLLLDTNAPMDERGKKISRSSTMAMPRLGCPIEFEETERKRAYVKRKTVGTPVEKQLSDFEISAPELVAARQRAVMAGHAKLMNPSLMRRDSMIGQVSRFMSVPGDALLGTGVRKDSFTSESSEFEEGARQTNGEALMNILNNQLGSGMVNIGYTFGQAGLFGGILGLLFAMTINRFTVHMVLDANTIINSDPTTTEVATKTYGEVGHVMLVIVYSLMGFFSMVAYIDAAADAVEGLMKLGYILGGYPLDTMPAYSTICFCTWLILDVPPTMIRSLKGVAVISFVAFIGAIALTVSLIISCTLRVMRDGIDIASLDLFPASFSNFLNAAPIMVCLYAIQAGSCTILATMVDNSETNCRKVSKYGMTTAVSMHSLLGVVTYVTFGSAIAGDVTKSFPATDPLAVIARIAILDLVVLSYVFMMIPCKFSMLDLIFHKNEALMEATPLQSYGTCIVINIATMCAAFAIPNLTLVMGLLGTVATPLAAFLMPPAMMVQARRYPENGVEPVPYLSRSNIPYFAVFVFGLVLMTLSGKQLITRFQQGE
jgi:amino acid permease